MNEMRVSFLFWITQHKVSFKSTSSSSQCSLTREIMFWGFAITKNHKGNSWYKVYLFASRVCLIENFMFINTVCYIILYVILFTDICIYLIYYTLIFHNNQ